MTWKPHVTVAAIIESDDGRFLLVEEHGEEGTVFNQPAGHLEDNESLLEAVQREVMEETGYRFSPRHLVGTYLWKVSDSGHSYLRFTIAGTVDDQPETSELDPDILATHWLHPEQMAELAERLRSPLVMRSLNDYLSGERHPLSLLAHVQ
ncbi:MAG: NUDIX hydrolase [Gammaproteobacteria bacterium]